MQGVLRTHCPSFFALRGFAENLMADLVRPLLQALYDAGQEVDARRHHLREARRCCGSDRLAEHGLKPHRDFLGSKKPITGLNLLVYA